MLDSPVGFPTSQSEARGGAERTSLPAFSSSPPAALPLYSTQTQGGTCTYYTKKIHISIGTSLFYPLALHLVLLTLLYTFDVDPGQNVLEGGGMKQVTHFLLGLRLKHNTTKGHFNSKETTHFALWTGHPYRACR